MQSELVDCKVSPYTIKNETGYPLQIELQKDDKKNNNSNNNNNNANIAEAEVTKVKNNQQANFDISSEFDEDQLLLFNNNKKEK